MQNQTEYITLLERQAKAQELANLIAVVSNPIIFGRLEMEQQELIIDQINKRTEMLVGKAVRPNGFDPNDLNNLGAVLK